MLFLMTVKEERETFPPSSSRKKLDNNFDGLGLGPVLDQFLWLGISSHDSPLRHYRSPHGFRVCIHPHTLLFPYIKFQWLPTSCSESMCNHKYTPSSFNIAILGYHQLLYPLMSSETLGEMSFCQSGQSGQIWHLKILKPVGIGTSLAISNPFKIYQHRKKRVAAIRTLVCKRDK